MLYRPIFALLLLLRSPSLRPFRHPHTCSSLALFFSSSQFNFGASFFFSSSSSQFNFGASFFSSSSSSSFALLQLLPPLRLLPLEVNILSPHLFFNDAHEFFSSTASRALIFLWTPPSHSLCVSFSPSLHSLCVDLLVCILSVFFWIFFGPILLR